MDYFRWNSVNWLDQFVLRLLDIGGGGGGGGALHLGRRLLRPHHHLRGHDVTSGHLGSQQGSLEKILGSIEGEICTLLLISDFYLRWRNPSVTISDQSVRRVTANHLCHECHAELITRDTPSLWSVIVTSLWHHWQSSHENCSSSTPVLRLLSLSILVTPLFWLHSALQCPLSLTAVFPDSWLCLNMTAVLTTWQGPGDWLGVTTDQHQETSGGNIIHHLLTSTAVPTPTTLMIKLVISFRNSSVELRSKKEREDWTIDYWLCWYCPVWPMYETWDSGHHLGLVSALLPELPGIIVLVCTA